MRHDAADAVYIEVKANVRFWDDADVNGEEDESGTLIPMRVENDWCPVIRLTDGVVEGWPAGTAADVHYKVCDEGEYWLLDANRKRIAKWGGYYVPEEFLCHGDRGYGDYIIMCIDGHGNVAEWTSPKIEDGDWEWVNHVP
jgi:hypothetical protein